MNEEKPEIVEEETEEIGIGEKRISTQISFTSWSYIRRSKRRFGSKNQSEFKTWVFNQQLYEWTKKYKAALEAYEFLEKGGYVEHPVIEQLICTMTYHIPYKKIKKADFIIKERDTGILSDLQTAIGIPFEEDMFELLVQDFMRTDERNFTYSRKRAQKNILDLEEICELRIVALSAVAEKLKNRYALSEIGDG